MEQHSRTNKTTPTYREVYYISSSNSMRKVVQEVGTAKAFVSKARCRLADKTSARHHRSQLTHYVGTVRSVSENIAQQAREKSPSRFLPPTVPTYSYEVCSTIQAMCFFCLYKFHFRNQRGKKKEEQSRQCHWWRFPRRHSQAIKKWGQIW